MPPALGPVRSMPSPSAASTTGSHSYRGNWWEHQTVTLPYNGHQTLGKNDFGALEIPKGPAIGEPAVCSMSRSKCIVPSVAFAQLRHRAGPNGTNHPANRSHSPLAIGKRSGRLVLTRPAARSIYSASLQTSDEPNDTAALRPEDRSLSARRRRTCQPTLKGDRCWSLVF